jgi:hypothetical protein
MILKFYYVNSDDIIAEIASGGEIPLVGQRVLLPDKDEVYVVISTIIDYREYGNNCANIIVVKEKSIA